MGTGRQTIVTTIESLEIDPVTCTIGALLKAGSKNLQKPIEWSVHFKKGCYITKYRRISSKYKNVFPCSSHIPG